MPELVAEAGLAAELELDVARLHVLELVEDVPRLFGRGRRRLSAEGDQPHRADQRERRHCSSCGHGHEIRPSKVLARSHIGHGYSPPREPARAPGQEACSRALPPTGRVASGSAHSVWTSGSVMRRALLLRKQGELSSRARARPQRPRCALRKPKRQTSDHDLGNPTLTHHGWGGTRTTAHQTHPHYPVPSAMGQRHGEHCHSTSRLLGRCQGSFWICQVASGSAAVPVAGRAAAGPVPCR